MSMYGWVVIGAVVIAAAAGGWAWRSRRGRPLTAEQKLRAARKAGRALRRSSPRASEEAFRQGQGVPDRHSHAVIENAAYGDAGAGGGGGGY
jgi:hypothetical protein